MLSILEKILLPAFPLKKFINSLGGTAKIGIYFLMVSFGASYGYTVMARISLLIGRVMFLLRDWLDVLKF